MKNNTSNQNRSDIFAQIGAQRATEQQGLVEPQPPTLPKKYLPAGKSNPRAEFRPLPKLDTAEKLQAELVRERKRHAPFLRNLAPALASARIVVPLEEFDWRPGTTGEWTGEWTRVRIPHYGGPIGRAVTYYRTTFTVTDAMRAKGALFVCFRGVDYKAHALVNDEYVGAHEGFFAPFEFEITDVARIGENTLLVKVENDAIPIGNESWPTGVGEGDKLYAASGPGWDDPAAGWHACPPGMGIYQPVSIEARPRLHLRDVFVRPVLAERRAEAWLEVFNGDLGPTPLQFTISVFGQNFAGTIFRDRVFVANPPAGSHVNSYRFSFDIPNPKIWDLETPWLYQIQVALPNGDTLTRQFGMRSFRMDTEHKPYGRLYLNNREIRLRGSNTMGFEQQDVIKGDFDQLRDDILLAKICHMNYWRLTQRPVQREVYEMCDRLGLMTQTDLPLFGYLPRSQFAEAVRQAEEMERLVRGHACNIMVSYINEPFPVAWGNKLNRFCSRAELEQFFAAASHAVHLANPDRVIKPVDGDYDPPGPSLPDNHCYTCWYNGHGLDIGKLHKGYWQRVKPDWFYACGEYGAEGLDSVALMRKYYPKAWLPQSPEEEAAWSPNKIPFAQTDSYHYMYFDTPRTLAGWAESSQRHQAWATRVMTEAFRRDSRLNSMAIHLFIDAFPDSWMKVIMDYDRQPKPAFFAYHDALTPLMANLRTDRFTYTGGEELRFEAWVCNDTHAVPPGARLRYQLEVAGQVVFAQETAARIEKCRSTFQGFLKLRAPVVTARTPAVVRLAIAQAGKLLHDTAVEIELFPAAPAVATPVVVVGKRDGKAAQLARELGLPRATRGGVYLVDDFAAFAKRRRTIEAAVVRGAQVVFLELAAGEYAIGGTRLKVENCGMSPVHFVSRDTGHPLVAGFGPADFRLWYDPAQDRITPLLHTTFTADGWTPVLATGKIGWGAPGVPALATAEKRDGAGVWCLCQVALAGRTATNPVAGMFARRLVEGGLHHA